jgi:hypothetical protein
VATGMGGTATVTGGDGRVGAEATAAGNTFRPRLAHLQVALNLRGAVTKRTPSSVQARGCRQFVTSDVRLLRTEWPEVFGGRGWPPSLA